MADPTPAAPQQTPEVKSGWKTTEAWLVMLAFGALLWLAQQTLTLLPAMLAQPGLPPWVAMLAPVVTGGLGWAVKSLASEYAAHRTALKLGTPADAGDAAAAKVATVDDAAKVLGGTVQS